MSTFYTGCIKNYHGNMGLDITVKGNHPVGRIWAPTWPMVMGYLQGNLSESEYSAQYSRIISAVPIENYRRLWHMDGTVLLCYCAKGKFCHRYILADYLVHLGFTYGGEL